VTAPVTPDARADMQIVTDLRMIDDLIKDGPAEFHFIVEETTPLDVIQHECADPPLAAIGADPGPARRA